MVTQQYDITFSGSIYPGTIFQKNFNRRGTLFFENPSPRQGFTDNFVNNFEIGIFSLSDGEGRFRFSTNNELVSGFSSLDTAYTSFNTSTNVFSALIDSRYSNLSANFAGDGVGNYSVFGGIVTFQPLNDGSIRGDVEFNLNADSYLEYVATFTGTPVITGDVNGEGALEDVNGGGAIDNGLADTGDTGNTGTTGSAADTADSGNEATNVLSPTTEPPTPPAISEPLPTPLGQRRIMEGSRKKDRLEGSRGKDMLIGKLKNDWLSGGNGDDILVGGKGRDRLIGGSGADQFVFSNPNEGRDRITDFSVIDDTILVSARGFKGKGKGLLTVDKPIRKKQFEIGKRANDRSDRFIYHKKSGILFFDPDGNGTRRSIPMVKLSQNLDITNRDIVAFGQFSTVIDS